MEPVSLMNYNTFNAKESKPLFSSTPSRNTDVAVIFSQSTASTASCQSISELPPVQPEQSQVIYSNPVKNRVAHSNSTKTLPNKLNHMPMGQAYGRKGNVDRKNLTEKEVGESSEISSARARIIDSGITIQKPSVMG